MADGQSVSNTSVKELIEKLIAEEDSSKPLSDEEIVKILTEGFFKQKYVRCVPPACNTNPIARRTVAKYRTELKILPSHLRKKF